MIKFIADSSCDTRNYNDTNIDIASLRIYTEERDYLDDENLDIHEMLDYLLNYKDRSYTACPSTQSWLNAFEGGDESEMKMPQNTICRVTGDDIKEC